jgi:hypothetical protein
LKSKDGTADPWGRSLVGVHRSRTIGIGPTGTGSISIGHRDLLILEAEEISRLAAEQLTSSTIVVMRCDSEQY